MLLTVIIIMFIVILYSGFRLSIKSTNDIPIFINGLIPSESNRPLEDKSGTTVYIVYINEETNMSEEEIFRGYADDQGRVKAMIPSSNIGRTVLIRVRHAAYKPQEFKMMIPEFGITHTVRMEKDGVYNGNIRGKDVGDLSAYYNASIKYANLVLSKNMKNYHSIASHPFARIPVWYWLLLYIILIFTFAIVYNLNVEEFNKPWESFIHTIYFSVTTITTLGYGDNYPTGDTLRTVTSLEAMLGIFIVGFALNSMFAGPKK